MIVLGINAFGHDAAAVLLRDGETVFASSEERYDRRRHSAAFPAGAIAAALDHAGLEPGDVEITIEGNKLTIKGERIAPLENVYYHVQELRYCLFTRTLTLNITVESEGAEAVFEKGVLTLTIPKAEEARPKMIKVRSK